ncbi:MAG: hypothetical protein HN348_07075, partial [Proteobacteria bacterium]|nr:hypothetical protein [Pseudomonadota bacterium]
MYTFDPTWLAKLDEFRAAGVEPYPNGLEVTHTSTELHKKYKGVEDPTQSTEPTGAAATEVAIAGRVMFRNRMGRAMFLRIQDGGEPTVED